MIVRGAKEFPSQKDYLREMIGFISGFAQDCGFLSEDVKKLELASEEAIVNVISYAYKDSLKGNIQIDCAFEDNRMLRVDIIDTGLPFNPLEASEPDLTDSIEDRAIGGLGIFFIKNFIDEVAYYRKDDRNILSLFLKKANGV